MIYTVLVVHSLASEVDACKDQIPSTVSYLTHLELNDEMVEADCSIRCTHEMNSCIYVCEFLRRKANSLLLGTNIDYPFFCRCARE